MATITEDYVSFETAKLLKKKGFPQEYDVYHSMIYNEEDYEDEYEVQRMVLETRLVKAGTLSSYPVGVPEPKCYCPSQSMAMKWLREVHNIDIEVHADVGMLGVKVYTPFISRYKSSTEYPSKLRQYKNGLYFEDDRGVIPGIRHFETYEEAAEAAIKYCLENLI